MKIKFYVFILISICAVLVSCKKKINPTLNKPLLTAVQAGDFAQVKKLVGDGADVNANIGGLLPLVEAINKKYTDIAKFLVDEEVNVNLQDKDGDTALIVAALRGNMEILPLLKKQGADFNIRNKQGKTALMYGVFNGSLPVVEYLLNNGADVVQQDNTGEDAVSMAIRKKDENTLKLLLVNGGAVTLKHLKLAFELLCVKSEPNQWPDYKSRYPKVTNALSEYYLITKNVDYAKSARLVKSIISEDGYRKAEQYDNGVIKIFNAKDNSFIKAYGNINFIKQIRFVLGNKMYIEKENNFAPEFYSNFLKFIGRGGNAHGFDGHSLLGVGCPGYLFWYIDENKFRAIASGEHFVIMSDSGRYYLHAYSSHVSGLFRFDLCITRTENTYFSWDYFEYKAKHREYAGVLMGCKAKFSNFDKHIVLYYQNYDNSISVAFKFDVATRKIISR